MSIKSDLNYIFHMSWPFKLISLLQLVLLHLLYNNAGLRMGCTAHTKISKEAQHLSSHSQVHK